MKKYALMALGLVAAIPLWGAGPAGESQRTGREAILADKITQGNNLPAATLPSSWSGLRVFFVSEHRLNDGQLSRARTCSFIDFSISA